MTGKRSYQHPPTLRGYSPYEVVSALQKAVRRSQVKEAVYWAVELWSSGNQAWCWNRIMEICSEDIGPAERNLPAQIETLHEWSEKKRKGGKGGGMELVHAVVLLATAPKSRITSWMVMEADSDHHERFEIPDYALDQHTRRGKQMGRGAEHFVKEGQTLVDPLTAAWSAGDLDVATMMQRIEQESMEHWLKVMTGDTDDLPDNPRAKKDETWVPPADKVKGQGSLLNEGKGAE